VVVHRAVQSALDRPVAMAAPDHVPPAASAARPPAPPAPPAAVATAGTPSTPLRRFARFHILRLLGRSAASMVWLVHDPRSAQELVLVLPRAALAAETVEDRLAALRRTARLRHPHLAPIVEVGEHERWVYAAYERRLGATLAERHGGDVVAPADAARWIVQALDGLAFAHEAGMAHRDLQLHLLVLDEQGRVQVMGLEVAPEPPAAALASGGQRSLSVDPAELQAQRDQARRDVLAAGLMLHHLLAGRPALDDADTGSVIARLPPSGRDLVRLPFAIPRPVPDALRAIANRATDRQPRQRYLNARTLARALQGWIELDSLHDGGTHALLIERVRQIGALPATPGGAARAARLALLERERINELAEIVLRDLALSFELLRVVNTAQVRGSQVAGNGPVLTVRRAIAMVGLEGVRRAANGLRPWPGPLTAAGAHELAALIDRVRRAGRVAQSLRPPGYDAEVVFLVTLLQNLGRLLVQYHFPDEAQQIARLTQPQPAAAGGRAEPGMAEEQAALAVLGCDIEGIGAAVARHWGMDEAVLHMVRRLPLRAPVRQPDSDDDMLRAVASAANEAIDALSLPAAQSQAALERVATRYVRVLALQPGDLQAAVQAAMVDRGVDVEFDDSGHAPLTGFDGDDPADADRDGHPTWPAAEGVDA
jgi:non-specific serine/threonine protein kinase